MTYATMITIHDLLESECKRVHQQICAVHPAFIEAYKAYDKYRFEHPELQDQINEAFFGKPIQDQNLAELYNRYKKLDEINRNLQAKYQQLDKALDEFHHQNW